MQLILEQMILMIISNIKPETKSKLIESFRDFSFDLVRSPFDPSFWNALYNGLMVRSLVHNLSAQGFCLVIKHSGSTFLCKGTQKCDEDAKKNVQREERRSNIG